MAGTRGKAVAILKNILEDKTYSAIAIDKGLCDSGFDGRDKAFVTNIVYGTLTNLKYIDYQIKSYSKTNIKKLSMNVLCILRISLYQIIFMDKVPQSAAVNEGVKLAKKMCFKSSGFINAILRSFLREGEKLPDKTNVKEYLSVKYSFEEYMVSMWFDRFGKEKCEKILKMLNEIPKIAIRVNSTKITRDELIEKTGGVKGGCESAVILPPMGSVSEIEGFEEGLFTVQDVAAQRVALMMAPEKDDRILDMCAAPGGKTTHMAEIMNNTGEVVAWDIHAHKIPLIENTAKRLGLTNIRAYVHDGKELDENLFQSFDKVLLDAPCSGLGIIKKKPEIKWERAKEDIEAIINEQKILLQNAAQYVKTGGTLIYSTCTINQEENEDRVQYFLENNKDFYLEEEINIFPDEEQDGFFIAKIKRKK